MIKLALLITALVVCGTRADLPVHCLKRNIVGRWTFDLGPPVREDIKSGRSCGHPIPDTKLGSFRSIEVPFEGERTLEVNLESNDIARKDSLRGTWTMIYDEGFEVRLRNWRFVAFNKYFVRKGDIVVSVCFETLTGWWTNDETGERGCWRGRRAIPSIEELERSIFIQHKRDSRDRPTDKDYIVAPDNRGIDQRVTEALNRIRPDSAQLDDGFWLGKPAIDPIWLRAAKRIRPYIPKINPSSFPRQFDTKWAVGPAANQGGCGSCYAISTMAMLSARLRIKYNDTVRLSHQRVLDCNMYAQSCRGGWSYLVSKFGKEFDLVPEECHPTRSRDDGSCADTCDVRSLPRRYRVDDYYYVGGAYGQGNELAMMEELMKNGPIVVTFEPPVDFEEYQAGTILRDKAVEDPRKAPLLGEWQAVGHSVLCVGWGERAGFKYWIILNTWGTGFGDQGYFLVRRGKNDFGIESMPEAAIPYIIGPDGRRLR
eukprot:TRINITY_DN3336_c0_g3_i3.p1 TRINITY_DN3336_c0_g3~~TRINITY_DN3336_c0_g3_i3.p1  ORF type:complete len:484 (+),score=93.76 TRINITY_DN3336_c0_g3_i3:60-1511(+)